MENNAIKRIESALPISTKQDLQAFAIEINKQLEDGSISGMELLRTFKMIEKCQEYVKETMMKAALAEADKHPGKDIDMFGVSFTKVETAVSYDYGSCNDDQYNTILETEEKLDKEKKLREAFLKSISASGFDVVDTDSGEVLKTIYGPVRKSKSTLQVKIK